MHGLLLRLSQLDNEAASALRVIGFFDRLVTEAADLAVVVCSAATLAECPAGISSPELGISLRADPGATAVPWQGIPSGATQQRLDCGTVVWIARAGLSAPLDAMVLERFAITVASRLDRGRMPLPRLGDPALVELVLSGAGMPERSRALHLLGLGPGAELRVLVTTCGPPVGHPAAKLGSTWAVLCPGDVPSVDGRSGVGPRVPAIEAARSWRAARSALRLTTVREPVIHWERLGCVGVLADCLDYLDLAQVADLAALDRLAVEPGGDDILAVLDALCANKSGRKAASEVYRHHSTITARVVHAEMVLGFSVKTPAGRFRLHLALMLRRLRDDPGERRASG